ncbi:hypothetical protein [Undibacterium oligocarboniphilum]|uniref:Uncharacterized protein n=1 Tax=Undibacterium oligocarboniphilum TaxID=666702 RepID=A0A850QSP1_9BURK|nr:hypothetical protein [Undibacterium oligocarboniphilum]MBC3871738.1 hypothetical protein [Undibacterium oligocarboniphilum]NVO79374.1 hypothetical protein [Undibacterium oligocarboniphilum]
MQQTLKTARKIFCLFWSAAIVFTVAPTTASATTPLPVPLSYRALSGLCLLEEKAAIDGVSGAYPIGMVVVTKLGTWKCIEAVMQQSPLTIAGIWVVVPNRPYTIRSGAQEK